MNSPRKTDITQEVESQRYVKALVADLESAAPDQQYRSAFALGALAIIAAQWHAQLVALAGEQVDQLRTQGFRPIQRN